MAFLLTPEEAQATALAVMATFQGPEYKRVEVEEALNQEAPYRSTLLITHKSGLRTLIEAQGRVSYRNGIKDLAIWIAACRAYSVVYLAVTDRAKVPGSVLGALKKDGVGLLLVDGNGVVSEALEPRNPALMVHPDPTLKFGRFAPQIAGELAEFNRGNRKGALHNLYELVEGQTDCLIRKAARKGALHKTEAQVQALDWAAQIDHLGDGRNFAPGRKRLLTTGQKADLHSFRGARNQLSHTAGGVQAKAKREQQFAERMMMGCRLLSELATLERRIQ